MPGRYALTAATALLLGASSLAAAQEPAKQPNFLIIVADDLGFSDLGAFGGEIETPNLDRLAMEGLRLTGFHTAAACAPTRAMLLTGSDAHRVGLGNMPESAQANQLGQPGYEGYLRPDTATIAERLSVAGYRTLFSGKWHLGVEVDKSPHARGFQVSFSMLNCCHNHFGLGLSTDPQKMSGYRENGEMVTELPKDFYSSRFFAGKLVEQLKDSKSDKPFFAYLAFTAPHAPIQAPPETIAKYVGKYDTGYEALRLQRLERQRELDLLDPSADPHRMVDAAPWDSLTSEEQRLASRRMEIYAAMVDELDQSVGKVIQHLEESGELDNTVIFFLSDNGAEGRFVPTGLGEGAPEEMGSATSYIQYGPGWAQAATAPYWRWKTFSSEGGIRTAAFVAGPGVAGAGGVAPHYTNGADIVPTILDMAGVAAEPGMFAGREVQPIDGLSWKPLLAGGAAVYPGDKPVGTELFGSRSIRRGDWKITDIGDKRWRLFNIRMDPGETNDLSDEEPARKAELLRDWEAYAREVNVVVPEPPLQPTPIIDAE